VSNQGSGRLLRTIGALFDKFVKGAAPIAALFRARTQLYETYHADELPKLLWRASPFRVYRLNQ
jgi:hypothetical protein